MLTQEMHQMNFIELLDSFLRTRVDELAEQMRGHTSPSAKAPSMSALLQSALKNEWETALLTAHWVIDEIHPDFRIELARLAGDEAKHFQLIEKRLRQLGGQKNCDELNARTPLFKYLIEQKSTFDRLVTGPYAREALAVTRNIVFLEHCKSIDDFETIKIYDEIQYDEGFHHQIGKKYLKEMINSEEDFNRARAKVEEILNVIDDIQEMLIMNKGICRIPGC